jgi:hypothetical protein
MKQQAATDWTLKRFIRIACWVLPILVVLLYTTKIGRFWRHCIREGWEVGEGCFLWIEGICLIIATGLRCLKERRHHEDWEKTWEPKIMKLAFGIFVLSFLVSTVIVAPFLQNEESEKGKKIATDELDKRRTNELAKADFAPGEVTKEFKKAVSQHEAQIVSDYTNKDPARAAMNRIAAGNSVVTVPSDTLIGLSDLRLEESNSVTQKAAAKALASESMSEAYRELSGTVEGFVAIFTKQISTLAQNVGDRVISTYTTLPAPPAPVGSETNFATIKMENNTLWNFQLALAERSSTVDFVIENIGPEGTPTLRAHIVINAVGSRNMMRLQIDSVGWVQSAPADKRAERIGDFLRAIVKMQDERFPLTNAVPKK